MFDAKRQDQLPTQITITKVRNGFILDETARISRAEVYNPYVFPTLDALVEYLVAIDWEVTDE